MLRTDSLLINGAGSINGPGSLIISQSGSINDSNGVSFSNVIFRNEGTPSKGDFNDRVLATLTPAPYFSRITESAAIVMNRSKKALLEKSARLWMIWEAAGGAIADPAWSLEVGSPNSHLDALTARVIIPVAS